MYGLRRHLVPVRQDKRCSIVCIKSDSRLSHDVMYEYIKFNLVLCYIWKELQEKWIETYKRLFIQDIFRSIKNNFVFKSLVLFKKCTPQNMIMMKLKVIQVQSHNTVQEADITTVCSNISTQKC
uniref:Uncharacterized protein n=1 Tax=Timema monikensis TaxID=170555 RepID=A0A7R9E4Q2_9NEOP|nr:unnamed protein product [Timema monikensis]